MVGEGVGSGTTSLPLRLALPVCTDLQIRGWRGKADVILFTISFFLHCFFFCHNFPLCNSLPRLFDSFIDLFSWLFSDMQ